jgi:hypothetical protein
MLYPDAPVRVTEQPTDARDPVVGRATRDLPSAGGAA